MSDRAREFTVLLGAAKAGEERAVAALWTRFEPAVRGAVRRRLSPGLRRLCDTADVTQSVFRGLLHDLQRLRDLGEDAFRHLLYLKTEGKIQQLWRRDGRRARAFAAVGSQPRRTGRDDDAASAAAERRERAQRAHDALRTLDGVTAEVVRAKVVEGQSFAEIARLLDLAGADAARKRFARGVLRLQRTLADRSAR